MKPLREAQPADVLRPAGQPCFRLGGAGGPAAKARRWTVLARHRGIAAWTLIEIMVVIAIMGIVLTMGIPTIYQLRKRADLRQTVADVVEVCSNARAQAIMSGRTVELHIRPQERRLDVTGAVSPARSQTLEAAPGPEGFQEPPARPRSGMSAVIPEDLAIEMVDVNFVEYKEAELARVRFHPNGTCDEMTLVLRSPKNEFRKIALEVTTSLAMVDTIGSR